MILVHVKHTWPKVLAGAMTAEESVLGDWSGIAQAALAEYGDVVAGVYNNTIVAVFDIDPASTDTLGGKVRFAGTPSRTWASLVGQPNPGKPWGQQGYARNVQYLDTGVVAGGDVPVKLTQSGRRAVVAGFTLTIGADGNATVLIPSDRTITVRPVPYPASWVTDGMPWISDIDNTVDDLALRDAYIRDGHADTLGPNSPRRPAVQRLHDLLNASVTPAELQPGQHGRGAIQLADEMAPLVPDLPPDEVLRLVQQYIVKHGQHRPEPAAQEP